MASASRVSAHDVELTHINAQFHADGTYEIDIFYDADAWLAGVRPEHILPADLEAYLAKSDAERSAREAELDDFIRRRIKLRFDDVPDQYDLMLIRNETKAAENPHGAVAANRRIRLFGSAPEGARTFSISCSKTFGNVILFQRCGSAAPVVKRMDAGGRSDAFELDFSKSADLNGEASTRPGFLAVGRQFVELGFAHILPLGLDHVAFVIGLFLLSTRWSALLWQVTAFTVAHSITLSLAVLGVVTLSHATIARVIEPLIALSIAFVAFENVVTSKLNVWRPFVVFAFGLLHGLGFASMLLELGIPQGTQVAALAGFNIGVEIGQIVVIGLAFAAVGWWRKAAWYRRRVVIPASLVIGLIGSYWAVERVFA
ncbi:MAG: HupE/UreJ family protein [Phycisphaerae bacterium]|nr:HupE/UreJ family protein [Phycisphaerae bacterium]